MLLKQIRLKCVKKMQVPAAHLDKNTHVTAFEIGKVYSFEVKPSMLLGRSEQGIGHVFDDLEVLFDHFETE